MATGLNVRVSDELDIKLRQSMEEVKSKSPLGAEVSNSTIIRGALEDFIRKIQDDKEGVKTVSYNLSKFEDKELDRLNDLLENMANLLKGNKSLNEENAENLLSRVLLKIKSDYLKEKIKFI